MKDTASLAYLVAIPRNCFGRRNILSIMFRSLYRAR
jgi:hypothetical protein